MPFYHAILSYFEFCLWRTPTLTIIVFDACRYKAKRTELERQKLMNEQDVEEARCTLLELQAVESSGQAKAEAEAQGQRLEKSKSYIILY